MRAFDKLPGLHHLEPRLSSRPTIYLGRWAGVEIRLDFFIVGIILLLFLMSLSDGLAKNATPEEFRAAFAHLALLLAVMVCVFFHEVGHAFACKLRGHKPTMILISVVGLTFFEAKKAKASDEFWIAVAGPMVNIGIALAASPFIGIVLADPLARPLFSQPSLASVSGFLAALSLLNFAIGLINLTPGWPTDGARAVRAWLARKRGFLAGTERAVAISHGTWFFLAGVSVLLLTVLPAVTNYDRPAASSVSMVLMYQFVVLMLSGMGIYYGWAELRRVRRLGETEVSQELGPPKEMMPAPRAEEEKAAKEDDKDESKSSETLQEAKKKAVEGVTAAKSLWAVARASGKGVGWFAKTGIKVLGSMVSDKKGK